MTPQTVLIVDDHPEFRAFARALVAAEGWDVVREAGDATSALAAARELRPDVVLLDVQLPDHDGFWVAEELARHAPAPEVVLMSSREASDLGASLSRCPVRGFLPKHELSGRALSLLFGAPARSAGT
jgi:DNA-binding NarL/FixJ family response regulator